MSEDGRNKLTRVPQAEPTRANALLAAVDGVTELHTNPDVGTIAGIGELHPERLTDAQIQSLCGEVMRHIRRMKGKG